MSWLASLSRSRPALLEVGEAYARWAPTYPREAANELMRLDERSVLRLLPDVRGLRVLDVGCGAGRYLGLLAARGASRVIGIDPEPAMLARAGAPVVCAGLPRLPIAPAAFDLVVCALVVGHLPDLPGALAELGRVLRPGGTLLLLEIGRPSGRVHHRLAAWYLGQAVPLLCRIFMPRTPSATLMRYFWDTIEHCVEPRVILDQLAASGFVEVGCETDMDLFRAYHARTPVQVSAAPRWNVLRSPRS